MAVIIIVCWCFSSSTIWLLGTGNLNNFFRMPAKNLFATSA